MIPLKNDFLTIPDAPNYEINSELIVRNKSTGQILKGVVKHNVPYYNVISFNKRICRTGKSFRHKAEVALITADSLHWLPVPSLNGKYELNDRGKLRNAVTKRILKKKFHNRFIGFDIRFGGKRLNVSLKNLMWEVFGVYYQPSNRTPLSCSARKNGVLKKFDSLKALAFFLADATNKASAVAIERYLNNRCPEFYGWKISYASRDEWTAEKDAVSKKLLRGVGK